MKLLKLFALYPTMKSPIAHSSRHWFVGLGLLLSLQCGTAQFAELTAEITVGRAGSSGTFRTQCIVGTNLWRMDRIYKNGGETISWFTGTNLNVQSTLVSVNDSSNMTRFPIRSFGSVDGNPGRSERAADVLGSGDRIAWLAFCSGPCFKNDERKLYPPGDFWKYDFYPPSSGFPERPKLFNDALGLPKSLVLSTTNHEPIFLYRVDATTNVLGWEFPTEFALTEYRRSRPGEPNCMQTDFFATGKLTGIRPLSGIRFPSEDEAAAEK